MLLIEASLAEVLRLPADAFAVLRVALSAWNARSPPANTSRRPRAATPRPSGRLVDDDDNTADCRDNSGREGGALLWRRCCFRTTPTCTALPVVAEVLPQALTPDSVVVPDAGRRLEACDNEAFRILERGWEGVRPPFGLGPEVVVELDGRLAAESSLFLGVREHEEEGSNPSYQKKLF